MRCRPITLTAVVALAIAVPAVAQSPATGYLLPPQAIVDILDAPPPPTVELSPTKDVVAVLERSSMPSIAELAHPMLRLGGVRINPATNGRHRAPTLRAISLRDVASGQERKITPPSSTPKLAWLGFSADGKRFAFTQTSVNGIELWVGESASGQAKAIAQTRLNGVLMPAPCSWVEHGSALLCATVPESRGAAPSAPTAPSGPNIQENRGRTAPVRTYEDLLGSPHDEAVFEHYATSQPTMVDLASGAITAVGAPGLYAQLQASPDGRYLLATRVKRPFSWLVPFTNFAKDVEVLDRSGRVAKMIADLPVADTVPNNGVLPGPRAPQWHPTQPATIAWVEALDNGDPKVKVPHRDRVLTLAAPFTAAPSELAKIEHRYRSLAWTDSGAALLTEFDRERRWTRTWVLAAGAPPRTLWDRSDEDEYRNPGTPLRRTRASGTSTVHETNGAILLAGDGASPEGARPFLDKLPLAANAKSERLFHTAPETYEPVVGVLNDAGSVLLTRYETRKDPPNVYVRGLETASRRALTTYADPAPQMAGIEKRLITYARKDGVQLSATLVTPVGWTPEKGRLPAILWAYPREFVNQDAAGQVTGSPYRFTMVSGASHLLLATQGFAIIDDPAMPIVGPGETANNTYVEQLVASAQAAVDKAAELGIVDPSRVVAGGHSYGAFMTANLLAHSDIFRAGIARSGAYNRTLTPFGFQNEQRTFWEVPEVYNRMSPFAYAHQIKEPVLLIHGEADDNSGTFPIQTERFYMALKGHGATVRYVTLPHEAHGYAARESVLHTLAEMLNWANEWAKEPKTSDFRLQDDF